MVEATEIERWTTAQNAVHGASRLARHARAARGTFPPMGSTRVRAARTAAISSTLAAHDQTPSVSEYAVLEPAACEAFAARVLNLRDYWQSQPRSIPESSFFTLGAASYLDWEGDGRHYFECVDRLNPILSNSFPELYATLVAALRSITGKTVHLASGIGLPGFHIWLADAIPREDCASIHVDLPHEHFVRMGRLPTPQRVLSFTLPLELPSHGSGLRIWNMPYGSPRWTESLGTFRSLGKWAESHDAQYVQYTVGHLMVHSGLHLHQIAGTSKVVASDRRITLQGHAAISDRGSWVVYW
jgi:hypothetical protein